MAQIVKTVVKLPRKFRRLFEKARYKIYYGGRGAAKTQSVAAVLVALAAKEKHKILCAREFQRSIADSVHAVLVQKIEELGLSSLFVITNTSITCPSTGSEFLFAGLRHNVNSIKSIPGITICWVEEAQTVSAFSWKVLIPTIREEESEIWVTYNPELDSDATHQMFIIKGVHDSIVVKVNYNDNPFFPDVLRKEMEALKATNYDEYLHVWEGQTKQILDGAIFANELRLAVSEDRVTSVPIDKRHPVHTAWDLGKRDKTCIWFFQEVAMQFRLVDYYENQGKDIDHYMTELQGRSYLYGTHYLPHDGAHDNLRGKSIDVQMRAKGFKVRVIPRVKKKATSINAAREIFHRCWFDADKCSAGLDGLRRYRYKVDEKTGQWSPDPWHGDDGSSDTADAFQQFALSLQEDKKSSTINNEFDKNFINQTNLGWMG